MPRCRDAILLSVQTPLAYSESVIIARSPGDLYDMVSDVTRMGEWSPVCRSCWWDEGDGPRTGIPETLAALKRVAEADQG